MEKRAVITDDTPAYDAPEEPETCSAKKGACRKCKEVEHDADLTKKLAEEVCKNRDVE